MCFEPHPEPVEGRARVTDRCRLYLITPAKLEPTGFAQTLERTLGAGDVASLQLRLKDANDDEVRRAVEVLMPIAQAQGVAFILNDRPDLAHELRCDGVHVGQDDMSYAQARAAVGRDCIVGVTCHNSRHLAIEAAEAGADYVAFGAFFPTATKVPKEFAGIETLRWWAELMVVPCVAIGGITIDNAGPLIEAGADFLAISSGVWNFPAGPEAAVKAFNGLFNSTVVIAGED
jgi:thiamine-phosphate pyrophosphorylase